MSQSDMQKSKLHIFISYPGKDGLPIARQAEHILKQFGHKPWVYENHNAWGYIIFEDITYRIRRWSQVMLYICTASSLDSWGQRFEVGHALRNPRVKILTVAIDGAVVPEVIDIFGYKRLQSNQFHQQFKSICNVLPSMVEKIQRLDESIRPERLTED